MKTAIIEFSGDATVGSNLGTALGHLQAIFVIGSQEIFGSREFEWRLTESKRLGIEERLNDGMLLHFQEVRFPDSELAEVLGFIDALEKAAVYAALWAPPTISVIIRLSALRGVRIS